MQFSTLFTTLLGAAAAFQGTRAAPIAPTRGEVFPLTGICNGSPSLPDTLLTPLNRNYAACHRRMEENPRLFGGLTAGGAQALCIAQAGFDTGLSRTLQERPSEIPVLREGLHRLAGSRADNPMPSPRTAGLTLEQLRETNFNDYRFSASTQYNSQLERQVAVLRAHSPASQRGSLRDARRAAASPACNKAWKRHLPEWVRTEIAERTTLVTMREVGKPESISHAQADALRTELVQMRFGRTAMKRRMREDALVALVNHSLNIRSAATTINPNAA
jgi:hypothetical protein